ncbi:hypothetical protein N7478_000148 [Penicillium angulare]|uniref:uncharacterized protein n=1 Tax=Penicillium angulare TaxID=116970 RepID=UPI0025400193|nr:uncharacterized protein N7478_000148 [Penicillium angulare]KAJ5290897.1 hypothetical protein N7478_000148 [Penicillium angulare]
MALSIVSSCLIVLTGREAQRIGADLEALRNYDAAVKANAIFLQTDRLAGFISMGYANDEVLIDPDTGRSITLTGAGRPLGNNDSNFVMSSVPQEVILPPLLPEHI